MLYTHNIFRFVVSSTYFIRCHQAVFYFQCSGVAFPVAETPTRWCCLIKSDHIRYRSPGNLTIYHSMSASVHCQERWAGLRCNTCESRWAGSNCDACITGRAGENCSACAIGWAGEDCDACALGWTGDNCDTCDFGFSNEGNCTECIQNGKWDGTVDGTTPLTVHLTFTGPTCSEITPGTLLNPLNNISIDDFIVFSNHVVF